MIVKAHQATISKISENQHRYSLITAGDATPFTVSIIEAAELIENITVKTDCVYYVLNGAMTVNDHALKKGDCCCFQKGDQVIITGTFRALHVSITI